MTETIHTPSEIPEAHDPVLSEVTIDYEPTGDEAVHAHEPRLRERVGHGLAKLNLVAALDRSIDSHTFNVAATTTDAERWASQTHSAISASKARREERQDEAKKLLDQTNH